MKARKRENTFDVNERKKVKQNRNQSVQNMRTDLGKQTLKLISKVNSTAGNVK